jgi:hypothetical protein
MNGIRSSNLKRTPEEYRWSFFARLNSVEVPILELYTIISSILSLLLLIARARSANAVSS